MWHKAGEGAVAYLAFAYGAWRVGRAPDCAAQTGDASGVLARLSDVVCHIISQAGVGDTSRAALPLRHRRVLAGQRGAGQRPAVHLPLLQREPERSRVQRDRPTQREGVQRLHKSLKFSDYKKAQP